MSRNPKIRKSAEKGISIILIIIIISGCTSNEQKTYIHETATAKGIVYYPNTQTLMHPSAEDTFKSSDEVIYACVNVTSTPKDSVLQVRGLDNEGNSIFEENKTVSCGIEGCWNCFNLTKKNDKWETGNYSAEFLISGDRDTQSVHSRTEFKITGERQKKVCVKDTCFYVELASTQSDRTRGLMFRESLDLDKGMLFIFEEEKKYSFWMKNTLIPLDIIWINKDNEVVYISKNTLPCEKDFCPNIYPAEKAKYVLEINGGISDKIGLQAGDKIIFDMG